MAMVSSFEQEFQADMRLHHAYMSLCWFCDEEDQVILLHKKPCRTLLTAMF